MKAKKFSFHAGLLCISALFVTLLLLLSSCGEDDKKPTETVDDKNFTYAVENGQATVASYTPSGEISPKLIIPSTLGGYPVVRIGEGAFSGLKNIKEIVLPDSVTDIGKEAFKDCSDLTNITIPDSVSNIGQAAFFDCTGLASVTIPNSVTSIGNDVFYHCTGLTSITIPNNVTSIGNSAFHHCTGLTSITIPNSVTSIGLYAFYSCTNLENIYMTDIAAWCKISGLHNLTNHNGSKNLYLYLNNELITNLVIPDEITSIGDYAFYRCTGLTSITIPDSVTSIGWSAFEGCTGLTSITIPDSVTSIGLCAFYSCTNLENIYMTDIAAWCKISGLLELMGRNADNKNLYLNNELITNLVIPNGVTSIGGHAFRGCTGLTSITIPDSVTVIGYEAFSDCTSLKFIYYTGTAAQWEKISKDSDAIPNGVRIVYNYKPTV